MIFKMQIVILLFNTKISIRQNKVLVYLIISEFIVIICEL